jgi:hypothetical protein
MFYDLRTAERRAQSERFVTFAAKRWLVSNDKEHMLFTDREEAKYAYLTDRDVDGQYRSDRIDYVHLRIGLREGP